MPKKKSRTFGRPTERTWESVASVAGRLLNGTSLRKAEDWLDTILLTDNVADENDRLHAATLLGAIAGMRRLAGSALTQR